MPAGEMAAATDRKAAASRDKGNSKVRGYQGKGKQGKVSKAKGRGRR